MKKTYRLLLTCLFLLTFKSVYSQQNLVPNPSFEDYLNCPQHLDNLYDLNYWSSYGNSSDYFNSCSPGSMNVPNAAFGFQFAHSGNAFCGIITYLKGNSPQGNNYREFIGAQLLNPLQIGVKYYASFYAVSANSYATGFFSNNIGLKFLNTTYDNSNPVPLDNIAQIKMDTILNDSINWYKISGSFVADSNYVYISIGNFYDALQTDTFNFLTIPFSPLCAYYYIDDICVTTDSLFNETWTSLHEIHRSDLSFSPNPVEDFFEFKSNQMIEEISVYDYNGRLVLNEKVNSMTGRVELWGISNGIYIATFRKKETISSYKFSKY